jgi:hypothetical protein
MYVEILYDRRKLWFRHFLESCRVRCNKLGSRLRVSGKYQGCDDGLQK